MKKNQICRKCGWGPDKHPVIGICDEFEAEDEIKLITINGLKGVVKKLYEDTKKLKGNSMIKVEDLILAFKEALENEEGKF
ncbi:hypothetical protein LCGC14_2964790 [marine sediment metagenome]|uniref:Uncharacterized protein n=1 Tax=marine sediment metagenome TaxID=412755 RepID=A0A0F8XYP0_9ZZZZ